MDGSERNPIEIISSGEESEESEVDCLRYVDIVYYHTIYVLPPLFLLLVTITVSLVQLYFDFAAF